MNSLPEPDLYHFSAAQGWLELGNLLEANVELEKITPKLCGHPDVLIVRWAVLAQQRKFSPCLAIARALTQGHPADSRGWVALAQTLHFTGENAEAYQIAVSKVQEFPDEWQLLYDSACYACLIGNRNEAEQYLQLAMATGDANEVRRLAVNDPDLEGLWGAV